MLVGAVLVVGVVPSILPAAATGVTTAKLTDPTWAVPVDVGRAPWSFATDFLGNSYVGRPGHVVTRFGPSGQAEFEFPAAAVAPASVDPAHGVTVDHSLRVTALLYVRGTVTFGVGPTPLAVDGGAGAYGLVQFDRLGHGRWWHALGASGTISPWRVAGSDQLIAVAGSDSATQTVGWVQAVDADTGSGRWQAPISPVPSSGGKLLPWAVAVVGGDQVYVGGWVRDYVAGTPIAFGAGTPVTASCPGQGALATCGFVAALAGADGSATRVIALGQGSVAFDLAADSTGVAITGGFGGPTTTTITFPGAPPVSLSSTFGTFVAFLAPNLDVRWANLTTPAAGGGVSLDARHHVQAVGDHFSDAVIGSGPGGAPVTVTGPGVWVASYDEAGTLQWVSNAAAPVPNDGSAMYNVTTDGSGVTRLLAQVPSATVGLGPAPIPAGGATGVLAAFAPGGPMPGSAFHGLPAPRRVLDSRGPTGGWSGPLQHGAPQDLTLPADVTAGATAAVVNVTVTGSTTPSFLTVYPTGLRTPNASNLNFATGETVSNLVTVPLGADGQIEFATALGATHVVVDLLGVYRDPSLADPQRFTPTTPARLLDSRTPTGGWAGPLAAGSPRSLPVSPAGPIPAGASTVVLSVAVTGGTANSYLQAYPTGGVQPITSNVLFAAGQTTANLVVVPVGVGGAVTFANQIGSVDVVADVVGYFDATPTAGLFHAVPPTRVLDDRTGAGGYPTPWGPATDRPVSVTTAPVVPPGLVPAAVSANLTVTNGTVGSYLAMRPSGTPRASASTLLFASGETRPTAVLSGVGPAGTVSIFNQLGSVDVILDINGYYTTS